MVDGFRGNPPPSLGVGFRVVSDGKIGMLDRLTGGRASAPGAAKSPARGAAGGAGSDADAKKRKRGK